MAHNHQDIENHHVTDARDIITTVYDGDGSQVNITGAEIHWYLKEDELDSDDEALLEKSTEAEGDEIEVTDGVSGEFVIHVETGDVEGIVNWEQSDREKELFHVTRLIDSEGRKATVNHGTFEVLRV